MGWGLSGARCQRCFTLETSLLKIALTKGAPYLQGCFSTPGNLLASWANRRFYLSVLLCFSLGSTTSPLLSRLCFSLWPRQAMCHELHRSFLFHQTAAGAEGPGEQSAALHRHRQQVRLKPLMCGHENVGKAMPLRVPAELACAALFQPHHRLRDGGAKGKGLADQGVLKWAWSGTIIYRSRLVEGVRSSLQGDPCGCGHSARATVCCRAPWLGGGFRFPCAEVFSSDSSFLGGSLKAN